MSENTIILSASGLKNIVLNCYEKENNFTFIFGGKEVQLKSIFAEFVSPIVSHLHLSDPTINSINFNEILNGKNCQKEISLNKFLNEQSFSKIVEISQGNSISINTKNTNEIKDLLYFSILLGNNELYTKLSPKIQKTKTDEIKEIELYYQISKSFPLISCSSLIDDFSSKISSKYKDELVKLPRPIIYSIIKSTHFSFDNSDELFDIINEVFSDYDENDNDEFYEESNYINFFYEAIDISQLSSNKFNELLKKIDYHKLTGKLWSDICEYFTQNKITKNNNKANKNEQTIEFDGKEENRFKGIIYHLNKDKDKNICDEGIINVTILKV